MKLKGNNLIIVNILATYARIMLVAGMGLFSTRWVLNALGEEDFGLYSVVGGLIVFILFIGSTMASSVQRFYAYAIGQGNNEEMKRWFNTAFILHVIFSILLIVIGIPAGNYLLGSMTIPSEKVVTCQYVYYFSILGAVGTMITTPYLAMYYARQRIFEIAFWNTFQAVLTFVLAWCLLSIKGDLLYLYSLGMVAIKLILDAIQIIRAYWLFNDCRVNSAYFFSKSKSLELLSFAFWSLFGAMGTVVRNQGMNYLINIFSGPTINAAFGIAHNVASHTNSFSIAMHQAISPEITAREGSGLREKMIKLSLQTSKFTVFLTLLWLIPVFLNIDYLLDIWLKKVPAHTGFFCKVIFITYAIDKMFVGYRAAIAAQGRIAQFQFYSGMSLIFTFPLAWGVFYFTEDFHLAASMLIITCILFNLIILFFVKKLLDVSIIQWMKEVFLKCLYVSLPAIFVSCLIENFFEVNFIRFFSISLCNCLIIMFIAYFYALDSGEKQFVSSKLIRLKNIYK